MRASFSSSVPPTVHSDAATGARDRMEAHQSSCAGFCYVCRLAPEIVSNRALYDSHPSIAPHRRCIVTARCMVGPEAWECRIGRFMIPTPRSPLTDGASSQRGAWSDLKRGKEALASSGGLLGTPASQHSRVILRSDPSALHHGSQTFLRGRHPTVRAEPSAAKWGLERSSRQLDPPLAPRASYGRRARRSGAVARRRG
jgi:hypothetical protein